jgi:transposase
MDLSPSFISGAAESFPTAEITFDRFHVVKLLNVAMDDVRKAERKQHDELKESKCTFLKNRTKLTEKQAKSLTEMIQAYPTTGEAYRLKSLFNDLWNMPNKLVANEFFQKWCNEVKKSQIPAVMAFAKTVKHIGKALFTLLNYESQMAYLKALTIRCS